MINDLSTLVKGFGGDLHVVGEIPVWFESPTTSRVGLAYESKNLFVKEAFVSDLKTLCFVIHEMGHSFASNKPPDESDESSFFGWEYAIAKQLRIEGLFKENYGTYNILWRDVEGIMTLEEVFRGRFDRERSEPRIRTGWYKALPFSYFKDHLKDRILNHYYDKCVASGLIVDGKAVAIR